MAYGKKVFITDTNAHTLTDANHLGTVAEYVEVLEDNTTFAVYTTDGRTVLEDAESAGNKLASATAGNRFVWNAGQVIRIPCKALTLATGAVLCHSGNTEA